MHTFLFNSLKNSTETEKGREKIISPLSVNIRNLNLAERKVGRMQKNAVIERLK